MAANDSKVVSISIRRKIQDHQPNQIRKRARKKAEVVSIVPLEKQVLCRIVRDLNTRDAELDKVLLIAEFKTGTPKTLIRSNMSVRDIVYWAERAIRESLELEAAGLA